MLISFYRTCLVGTFNEAHLSASKVFRPNCVFANLKSQTNTAEKGVVLL